MSINNFVILPGSKNGFSVKLKAKSVQQLEIEKVQLELENKEMEKKLQQLQSNMSREKQEREQASGYRWRSGQPGLVMQPQLLPQNKENIGKVSSGKVRLRLLKEQDQTPEQMKQPLARKKGPNDIATSKSKVKGKACGQCEIKTALLVCLECGEDYCPSCFASMHQKGALKLHRTTSLQAKTLVPVRKLEAAQQFLKAVHTKESDNCINSDHEKDIDKIYNTEESSTESSMEVRSESQNGGSLLDGTFNEEESSKSFQEAVSQWRSGNYSQKSKEERSCQVGSDTYTCQVQTSPPVEKKRIEIEFKEDNLKYMERLLIKKQRRTPVNNLPDRIIADELKLERSLVDETFNAWAGEEEEEDEDEDIAIARFAAREMKKYWADVFKQEEPEAVFINTEQSLKIKILDDDCEEEPEEPTKFVVMEAGSDELDDDSGTISNNWKTGPDIFLAQAASNSTRSLLSSAVDKQKCLTVLHNKDEVTPRGTIHSVLSERPVGDNRSSEEEKVSKFLYKRTVTKEKNATVKRNSLPLSSKQILSLPDDPVLVTELVDDCRISPEINKASLITTRSSALLQEVALRDKPICVHYQGLEGFFTSDTSCQQVMVNSVPSSPHPDRQTPNSCISFSGSEEWRRHFSLSECASESVVQDVLKTELARPLSRLQRQSPNPRASPSPFSTALQSDPRNSPTWPLSRAASEISEIEGIDVSEHDDPFLEDSTDQLALVELEDELQSNADPHEEFFGLSSGDSKMLFQNTYFCQEINDNSKGDSIKVYNESYTDDEDNERDKQQVIELH